MKTYQIIALEYLTEQIITNNSTING